MPLHMMRFSLKFLKNLLFSFNFLPSGRLASYIALEYIKAAQEGWFYQISVIQAYRGSL